MAKFVFALNHSLDGYVDQSKFRGGPALFQHWTEYVRNIGGLVYGRRIYEVMRYWDEDQAGWGVEEHAYSTAWRRASLNMR